MRLLGVELVKRVNHVFHVESYKGKFKIPAIRKASDGYVVILKFDGPTQIDYDFQTVYPNCLGIWIPSAYEIQHIIQTMDLSDHMTCDYLHNGKGWKVGPRPFPKKETQYLHEFL